MATIQWFINVISPSSDEIVQISTSWNTIRNTIESNIDFVSFSKIIGSYIRGTKISPIDDLDLIFKLNCRDSTYLWEDSTQKKAKIYIHESSYNDHPLKYFSVFEGWRYYISPNKILNKVKSTIKDRYYQTTDISRRWECITTYFSSYDLTVDCMPYTWVKDNDFIFIPTSWNDLYWKKSNPDQDKKSINELNDNEHFNWKFKGVIRVMKYWNMNKNSWVRFRSYVLECIIYHALKWKTQLYNWTYTEILKSLIRDLYNKIYHNILDISWYDYIYYNLSNQQWEKIKWLLQILWNKINISEDEFISYLKS